MRRNSKKIDLKKINRNNVFRYISSRERTSMPEMAEALKISGPTILGIVNDLKKAGVVEEVGEFESTGGRKAKALAVAWDAKYALGIDITKNHLSIVHTNLSGESIVHERIRKPFVYEDKYFTEVAAIVSDFIRQHGLPEDRIVGIGVAVPAIIEGNGKNITNSHALEIYEITEKDKFLAPLPFPAELINDANAAAFTELGRTEYRENLVYLSLSNTVGGAIVFGGEDDIADRASGGRSAGKLYMGDNWRSGEFGHMVLHPDGKKCYCGKNGCADAYCSALVLAKHTDGILEDFFTEMEKGNGYFRSVWNEYLSDLAIIVDNLRMCFDCKIILGGYVGNCMEPYLEDFRRIVSERNIFDTDGNWIKLCHCRKEASALGAAVLQIEKFIQSI